MSSMARPESASAPFTASSAWAASGTSAERDTFEYPTPETAILQRFSQSGMAVVFPRGGVCSVGRHGSGAEGEWVGGGFPFVTQKGEIGSVVGRQMLGYLVLFRVRLVCLATHQTSIGPMVPLRTHCE